MEYTAPQLQCIMPIPLFDSTTAQVLLGLALPASSQAHPWPFPKTYASSSCSCLSEYPSLENRFILRTSALNLFAKTNRLFHQT